MTRVQDGSTIADTIQVDDLPPAVDDDRRRPGLGDPLQSQGKFRSAHAAAERDDLFLFSRVMTPCGYRSGHRNRS
jgi:hypothetical protein